MPVIGHSIRSLNAGRKSLIANKIDINSTPKIKDVKEKKITVPGVTDKQSVLTVDFEFETTYKPDIGNIKINGDLMYTGDDNKKVLKEWEKNKKLPAEADIEIKNFLLRKCLLLGVTISQEMQLPPPLVIPSLKAKTAHEPNYIG